MPMIVCWAMVDSFLLIVQLSRALSYPRGVHNIGLLVKTFQSLRALMKSALPRLITTAASRALSLRRLGGSRSDRSCHQRVHTSHCAEGLLALSRQKAAKILANTPFAVADTRVSLP